MEHNELIKQRAAQAFNVSESDVTIINRLLGGMSHLTYHIQINGVDYTYRVIGKDGNLFVDRKIELENLNRIKPLGLNNETVYFDVESGEKAAKYVEGTVLTQLDFRPYLVKVSETLKTLHHTHLKPASDYGLMDRLNLYETYTEIKSPLYIELKDKWIKLYQEEHAMKPKVFCHNDAQRSNMVVSNDRLYLLDWEYAGLNEFYYDIASFGNVDFNDALELLDVYLGRKATKDEQDSVRFYRMFQALQWHQVALRKEIVGLSLVLHFDFKMLAEKYLNLANTLYHQIKG
ncbi:MAG: choline kinase family protein [Acholeplasmataceae bacterium]|jgi:thiamine kinase-like enzyme|nr:choline kinase family protein [Acholeplasmataceae bacterium]